MPPKKKPTQSSTTIINDLTKKDNLLKGQIKIALSVFKKNGEHLKDVIKSANGINERLQILKKNEDPADVVETEEVEASAVVMKDLSSEESDAEAGQSSDGAKAGPSTEEDVVDPLNPNTERENLLEQLTFTSNYILVLETQLGKLKETLNDLVAQLGRR